MRSAECGVLGESGELTINLTILVRCYVSVGRVEFGGESRLM